MSKSSKKINQFEAENEIQELVALGYRVVKKMPWHWRITLPDHNVVVDVWPTVKKLYEVDKGNSTKIYKDFFEEIQSTFKRYRP